MNAIPLNKNEDGYLEIKVLINGVEGKFIIDTGATGKVIGTNKLSFFGINLHKSAMGFSFTDVKLHDNKVRLLVDTGTSQLILDESALIQFALTQKCMATSDATIETTSPNLSAYQLEHSSIKVKGVNTL